jgi:hypothetical protein
VIVGGPEARGKGKISPARTPAGDREVKFRQTKVQTNPGVVRFAILPDTRI